MSKMEERRKAVFMLLEFSGDLTAINGELQKFGWDCEKPLAVLEPIHVCRILDRFLAGDLSAVQVEDWANSVECRDDIEMEASHEGALENAIFLLANPEINFPISPDLAMRIVKGLDGKNGVA